jgi:ArsR family transcriptional regulator, lead/cadmium/zinc/bismuth-responsive transcriptional repressor
VNNSDDARSPNERSDEQALDILAQWKAHSLATHAEAERSAGYEEAARMADLFKVLADPTRVLTIQALIAGGEMCVRDLATAVAMSQSSVSHHLRILRHFQLVRARRSGRETYYSPDDVHVELLLKVCLEHLNHIRR